MADRPSPHAESASTWTIGAGRPSLLATIADVWRYRRMLPFVATRPLQKIYRRTILGWAWLVILPLFPILLRTAIFGGLLAVASDGVPYILFIAAGSLIWDMFALGLTWGTRALEISGNLVEQVYLPRTILPIGNMSPALLDFILKLGAFALIVAWMWMARGNPHLTFDAFGWTIAALAVTWLFALGLSFFTSVWGESLRDARLLLGQVLAVWYLLTPVVYPLSAMPEGWRRWAQLNPMTPVVETFKWSLFGVGQHDPRAFAIAAGAVTMVVMAGLMYFARADAAAYEDR